MKKQKRTDALFTDKGFTLMEVCITMVILSIGLLAIGSLQMTTTRSNSVYSTRTEAKMLAQDQIEVLSEQDSISLTSDNDTIGIYNRSWVVATLPSCEHARIATVTVSWKMTGGSNRDVSLTSYVRGDGS